MPEKITQKKKKTLDENSRKQKLKKDMKQWVLFTVSYVILSALVIGTAQVHFPEPVQVLGGLYADIAYAISMLIITLYLVITGIIFKK